jgi:hypothetical protein
VSRVGALWLSAVGLAALAAWTLYDAVAGLSWGLWTVGAVAAGVACGSDGGPRPGVRSGLGVLACLLAVSAAVTADRGFHFWAGVGTVVLLGAAVRLTGDPRPARITLPRLLTAAPVTALAAVAEASRRIGALADALGGTRWRPVVRGGAAAVVVVGTLGSILGGADPVLGDLRDGIVHALERLAFLPRMAFFLGVLVLALGALGAVLRAAPAPAAGRRAPAARWTDVERLIVIASVVALFTTFFALQLAYLFGNPAAVAGSGITFAEYARRGFAELSIVVTLGTLLLLGLERHAARGAREAVVRALSLVLVAEMALLLASAFRRVSLYEAAYGFTTTRLYAQTYMVVMALGMALLVAELTRGVDAARLVRRVLAAGVLAFVTLAFWNHEAWIAQANLARHAATGRLDAPYLVWSLSPNGAAALARAADGVPALREGLRERYAARSRVASCRWFEWNLRHRQAVDALVTAGLAPGGAPAATVSTGCVRIEWAR